MKKELLLVLGIIEGRDWHPIEGHKTVIEAHLDSHRLTTEAFPLTNSPKFNTEITWEAEKHTIRGYKLNRVPIKIECYSLDRKNTRKLLGYVILPLTSAVEGVKVDAKWHRLLGGHPTTHKTPPSILLRLHLEAMTLDQQNQINNRLVTLFKSGVQHPHDEDRLTYLLGNNKYLANRQGLEINIVNTNGTSKTGNKDVSPHHQPDPLVQNSHQADATNGISADGRQEQDVDSDAMEDDPEDLYDFDSEEEYSDSDPNCFPGMIVDAFSLSSETVNNCEKNSPKDNSINQEKTDVQISHVNDEGKAPEEAIREKVSEGPQISGNTCETLSNLNDKESADNPPSDYKSIMQARSSAREHLRSVSQTLLSSKNQEQRSSTKQATSDSQNHDAPLTYEKRELETSVFKNVFDQRSKSRRLNSSTDISKLKGSDSHEDPDESFLKLRLAHDQNASSAAILLSHSLGNVESSKARCSSEVKGARPKKLIPHLNQDEGFFSIGPREGELEEQFVLSITIVYAKNLSKVIPKEIIPSLKKEFQFCYSLLGYSIYTDSFNDLDNPDFLAENASANIRSSHESLSQYFLQHYFLPVHFLGGETNLGVCNVDVGELTDIATKNEVNLEGVYVIESTHKQKLEPSDTKTKALLGITITLSKPNKDRGYLHGEGSAVDGASQLYKGKSGRVSFDEIVLSDSMESGTDSDQDPPSRRVKTLRKHLCHGCRNHFSEQEEYLFRLKAERAVERQKKALLHQAAYEVERWKEEQEKYFLTEWTSKEETMQRLIASEWNSKAKLMEGELSHRLQECDKLHEKLNSSIAELSVREEKIRAREARVNDEEQQLKAEKEKVDSTNAAKGSQIQKDSTTCSSKPLWKQAQAQSEGIKISLLQKEVSKLREELVASEENFKTQTQEVISLRRKLIQSDDIIGTSKEKESLEHKIENLHERKQYYKSQWLIALTDLHKLHSAHKKTVEEITHGNLPQEFVSTSNICYKLRKLRDERRILLDSGFYSSDHSIIKTIDKKIKELIG